MGPLLRKKGETGDYVHDAVVQFLKYGPRFIMSGDGQFRALLLQIVENALRSRHDWFTARRRDIARERPLPPDTVLSLDPQSAKEKTPSKSAERHEREAWVRLGLELVEPEEREILVLRQWDNLTFEEIGKRLGVSRNTAQRRHYGAVLRLARKVDDLRHGSAGDSKE
jgi:RNA polymerase sigma-70 factor (ECF subfamily)